jgi:hypothetical protein
VPYDGPPLVLDREGRTAMVILSAPTPGWLVGVDRVVEGFKRRDVFLSIERPNPKFTYAQVIVEQRVMTNVTSEVTLRLFARVLDSAALQPTRGAYRAIAVSDPVIGSDEPGPSATAGPAPESN